MNIPDSTLPNPSTCPWGSENSRKPHFSFPRASWLQLPTQAQRPLHEAWRPRLKEQEAHADRGQRAGKHSRASRHSCPCSQKHCLLSKSFWQGAGSSCPRQGFWKLADPHLLKPQGAAGLLPFMTASGAASQQLCRESKHTMVTWLTQPAAKSEGLWSEL